MPAPQLSVMLKNFSASDPGSWQPLIAGAQAADQAGVDRLAISDHVVFGENLEAYGDATVGGIDGGKQPTGPDGMWLEPLTLLSVLSGVTSTIRLATGILQAALRRPVVLAKAAATLDVLSGGRLDLGVGVGWQREEYDAAGLSFEDRGRLLNETLAVCRTLWREERADFDGPGLHFEGIHCMPKPLQPGGVPILVSGTLNDRVIDRVVQFGDGWIPWGPDAMDPVAGIGRLRDALAAAGRDATGFQVFGSLPVVKGPDRSIDLARTMEGVPALAEAGVTDFRAPVAVTLEPSARADRLAEMVTAFREAVGRS
ncbi:MAG TPA: TIGR03619 family F420-dependent LLM class oxidoreductase [Acidimicrobiales bacterium]|jgi:probable F420-dependent oxidoreductase|nr:TIGR03619 family F420-dependent LLM class oxidoreductase [Acidimicrobiales bacterium]